MPWSNNGGGGPRSSGPWGGGGGRNNGGGGGPWGGGGGRGGGPGGPGGQGPRIDDFFKKGQNQLKSVFGDGGGFGVLVVLLIAAAALIYVSVFTVEQNERAVILTFGEFSEEVGPGLNFAPWPVQTAEIQQVTIENTIRVGGATSARTRAGAGGEGVMLTGDENIVDISFEVVWVIDNLQRFLFNLAEPNETIEAVAISAMREIVGQSRLAPLLNQDRVALANEVLQRIQSTLDSYESGVRVVRVTLDRVDPPPNVLEDFRAVQAAEQERETLLQQAEQYYKETTAAARGEAAQIREEAEAYYAAQVAAAEGEASRFNSVLAAYREAPEITRRRLYIETMQRIFEGANKVFIDSDEGGTGILPYLPLDRLGFGQTGQGQSR